MGLFQKIISIDDYVFIVEEGASGYLTVKSAKLDSKFEVVNTTGTIPLNRKGFSLCNYDADQFLLSGGVSSMIIYTEFYLFNTKDYSWKQMQSNIESRAYHESICVLVNQKFYVYLFGGVNFLKYFKDLLIITIDTNIAFKVISPLGTWPSSRVGHALTYWKSFVYLIGGTSESSKVLDEIWMLDFKLFPENPSWKKI